ncbi:MAG: HPF/RaiA family ribosome-associated protein [Actinobacteria bacterium]|nr:HPF/RaiA family ribosome-associated protein [Actinomycetota bacterium]
MEVPSLLLDAAQRKLAKLDALLDESGWVEIGFVEEKNPRIAEKYHCEIVAHVKGRRLKVEASAGEAMGALDRAADKVDRQIRRLKDKRVRGRLRRKAVSGNGNVTGEPVARIERPAASPRIVERQAVDAKPMTPEEAAMQLEVLRAPVVLFVDADTGRPAVVYRRPDGDYGLAEMPG